MSAEQAKAFIEKMKSDEAFRARVMAAEDVDARMALITAEGFDCSAAEIGALQELADLDLSAVVGGSGPVPCGVAAPCEFEERSGPKLII
jgi:predicted ribosomally synthesized peptide with nif11-like leader